MKILFLSLSSSVENLQSRGIYSDLLRYFCKNGHDIYATYPYERRFNKRTKLIENERYHSLGIQTLNITKTNFIEKGIGTILLESQFLKAINKYWHNVKFDLVIVSTPPTSFNKVLKQIKIRDNAKIYLLQKDFFLQGAVDLKVIRKGSLIYKFFKKQEEQLYRLSDYIGCMSQANVDFLLNKNSSISPKKVEICPNSIELIPDDNKEFDRNAILQKYQIPNNIPIFMYGGNIGMPQGINFLLKILDSNKNRKDVFFCVVGGGTYLPKLLHWYETNRPSNVLIRKELPKIDYDVFLKVANVGLLFLDYRFTEPNFPSRLLSYLENKIPVLSATDPSTDVGKLSVLNGFGMHSLSNDLEAFNNNLNFMLSHQKIWKEMGEKGYQFLCSNYLVSHSYETIIKHFK